MRGLTPEQYRELSRAASSGPEKEFVPLECYPIYEDLLAQGRIVIHEPGDGFQYVRVTAAGLEALRLHRFVEKMA